MYESTYAESLDSVRKDMASVRKNILSGKMTAEDGEAVAKAGHVEVKAAEVDLHARVFAHKVGRNEPIGLEAAAEASVLEPTAH
jgi:N-acetylglutamate synthase/N-acetylornithine aminotransferase